MKNELQRKMVRERYGEIALTSGKCCKSHEKEAGDTKDLSLTMGYSEEELRAAPDGANLGLGCGNPTAIAQLKAGETVLDLGSGAGFDAFLARNQVGAAGLVIGVDMTSEMIEKARSNAEKQGYSNVEFRLGEIENLPVADAAVDVIISNCVINLSPEKDKVFREAFRVLKPGGRFHISDIVRLAGEPTENGHKDPKICNCIVGAERVDRLERLLDDAGFENIRIKKTETSDNLLKAWENSDLPLEHVVSAVMEGRKPV
ncbi:Methyltransferase domain-containing protein [Evansella caseinilytica]|uniref:Arsenite methyltransferase n=1 Tax=Evansella caseinilytica TaxID=1503961 RepID=A0A1H3UGC3_9BACI|nr:arsenite methyltransferase [Evansella caseinilytica]SDZ61438.1 Methyltransferase domain-containing protein [Evansella caseinilytica]